MLKKGLIILLILGLVGGVVAYKMYNKPHADMAVVKPDFRLSAQELFTAFDDDENSANDTYLGKKIQLSGSIVDVVEQNGKVVSIYLDTGDLVSGIACLLDEVDNNHRADFKVGEKVTFNCVCAGKLMDVELNRCVEIKKK